MTFALAARCRETGMLGVAVASSSPAVAARCAFTRARVGAVLTQNVTDPALGPMALDLLAGGMDAREAVAFLAQNARFAEFRQVLVMDAQGQTAAMSGATILGRHSDAAGRDVVAAGNLLANEDVPTAMVEAFEDAEGDLGSRLLWALHMGREAGGEAGPIHSAGLQVAHEEPWPYVDLRCDWTEGDPIGAVAEAWRVYAPQADDYVTRALDPTAAPSYGVPGDD